MKIQVVNNSNNPLPKYETEGAAAMDLLAWLQPPKSNVIKYKGYQFHVVLRQNDNIEITLYPGGRVLIPTGIHVAIPHGYELQIRPRSGLALKQGISIVNSPGTIDSDYRGDVGIILINHGEEQVVINNGDRIAQAVLSKVEEVEWDTVDVLPETTRGEGGFGHTGN